MAQYRPGLGPYSRLLARGSVDGRSRKRRYLAALKTDLNQHVGGNPSIAAVRLLIEASPRSPCSLIAHPRCSRRSKIPR
jgi:hypothetical protein